MLHSTIEENKYNKGERADGRRTHEDRKEEHTEEHSDGTRVYTTRWYKYNKSSDCVPRAHLEFQRSVSYEEAAAPDEGLQQDCFRL